MPKKLFEGDGLHSHSVWSILLDDLLIFCAVSRLLACKLHINTETKFTMTMIYHIAHEIFKYSSWIITREINMKFIISDGQMYYPPKSPRKYSRWVSIGAANGQALRHRESLDYTETPFILSSSGSARLLLAGYSDRN